MTGDRPGGPSALQSRLRLAVLLVGVLCAALVVLPRRDDAPAPASEPAAEPTGVMPTATPDVAPSEEAFCDAYGALAAVQGQYLAQPDEAGAQLLRDTLDGLLATGIPESMGVLPRTGLFIDLSGVYESLGETLDRRAVPGAAEDAGDGTSLSGASGAFGEWLVDLCPGW